MVYHRPDAGSLQAWADAVGDDSYTFDQFVPYFRKSVSFTPPNNDLRAANASVTYDASAFDAAGGGPVQVTYPNYGSPWSTWLQTGLSAIGLADTADFNRGKLEGHNYCTCMIDPKSMKRSSSQTAYLDQANGRPNLHVHQLTMAKKILFDGNKRATGVQIRTGATLFARREVIVSAGAFQSPQLLMVSGVGPAAALTALGIQVVADRPGVGQNMTDHVFVSPSYRVRVDTFTKIAVSVVRMLWEFTTNFTLFKKGPLTDPIASYLGWEKVPAQLLPAQAAADLASLPATWPTIEYLAAPGYIGDFKNLLKIQPKDGYQYASILTVPSASDPPTWTTTRSSTPGGSHTPRTRRCLWRDTSVRGRFSTRTPSSPSWPIRTSTSPAPRSIPMRKSWILSGKHS
jgi:choline dehydrogenase-like flavoprotein